MNNIPIYLFDNNYISACKQFHRSKFVYVVEARPITIYLFHCWICLLIDSRLLTMFFHRCLDSDFESVVR